MKLIDVTVEGNYLVIHTDEGPRRQSMNWRGVQQLQTKAESLKGKNIRTTTSGGWDPLTWFATVEEVPPGASKLQIAPSPPSTGRAEKVNFALPVFDRGAVSPTFDAPALNFSELNAKAEAGDAESQLSLAKKYDEGVGTERNLSKAMLWYGRAAEQGQKEAAKILGMSLTTGAYGSTASPDSFGNVTKIYGPPGTGKTHTLLELVQEALASGVSPDQIGYFSYTNKATEEAMSRMAKLFSQYDVAKDFPYFQTLHSLANQSLRARVTLLSEDQARIFDPDVQIERPLMREGDESSRVVRVKHPILDAASTARALKQSFVGYLRTMPTSQRWPLNKLLGLRRTAWESPFSNFNIEKFSQYHDRFEAFKKSLGAIDYADMLERAIDQSDRLPEFELLIVDEAQDLTPVQWDMVRVLITRARRTYVAGDDDQAICESFGARATEFVNLPSNQDDVVLNESRRVPPSIHSHLPVLVGKLQARFPHRKDKVWSPKVSGPSGEVHYLNAEDDLLELLTEHFEAKSTKPFMVMFPTNGTLRKFSDRLRHHAIGHFAANELVGDANFGIKLLTVWSAKGGESDFAALVASSDMDKKMLAEDPRLEYVAATRAKEVFYYVGFPAPAPARPTPVPESRVVRTPEATSKPTVQPISEAAIQRLTEKFGGAKWKR